MQNPDELVQDQRGSVVYSAGRDLYGRRYLAPGATRDEPFPHQRSARSMRTGDTALYLVEPE